MTLRKERFGRPAFAIAIEPGGILEAGGDVQIRQLDGDLALGRLRFLIVAQHLHLGFGAGQERVRLRRHAGCIRTKPESCNPHLGPHSEHGHGAKLPELHRVRDALVRDLTIAEALQVHHPKVIAPELQPLKIRLRDRPVRDHAPQRIPKRGLACSDPRNRHPHVASPLRRGNRDHLHALEQDHEAGHDEKHGTQTTLRMDDGEGHREGAQRDRGREQAALGVAVAPGVDRDRKHSDCGPREQRVVNAGARRAPVGAEDRQGGKQHRTQLHPAGRIGEEGDDIAHPVADLVHAQRRCLGVVGVRSPVAKMPEMPHLVDHHAGDEGPERREDALKRLIASSHPQRGAQEDGRRRESLRSRQRDHPGGKDERAHPQDREATGENDQPREAESAEHVERHLEKKGGGVGAGFHGCQHQAHRGSCDEAAVRAAGRETQDDGNRQERHENMEDRRDDEGAADDVALCELDDGGLDQQVEHAGAAVDRSVAEVPGDRSVTNQVADVHHQDESVVDVAGLGSKEEEERETGGEHGDRGDAGEAEDRGSCESQQPARVTIAWRPTRGAAIRSGPGGAARGRRSALTPARGHPVTLHCALNPSEVTGRDRRRTGGACAPSANVAQSEHRRARYATGGRASSTSLIARARSGTGMKSSPGLMKRSSSIWYWRSWSWR